MKEVSLFPRVFQHLIVYKHIIIKKKALFSRANYLETGLSIAYSTVPHLEVIQVKSTGFPLIFCISS